jgi:HEAT repeat protein
MSMKQIMKESIRDPHSTISALWSIRALLKSEKQEAIKQEAIGIIPEILYILNDDSLLDRLRQDASQTLISIGEDAIEPIMEQFSDLEHSTQKLAITVLIQLKSSKVVDLVQQLLNSKHTRFSLVLHIIQSIPDIYNTTKRQEEMLVLLQRYIDSNDWILRIAAIISLGKCKPESPSLVEHLLKKLHEGYNKSIPEEKAIYATIGQMANSNQSEITRILTAFKANMTNDMDNEYAILAIAQMGHLAEPILPDLLEIASSNPRQTIRHCAIDTYYRCQQMIAVHRASINEIRKECR